MTPPKLNDLVIAFSTSISEEILTGIVYAIEYTSGSPRNCKIHVGEDIKSVPYDRVMVLDRKSEQ